MTHTLWPRGGRPDGDRLRVAVSPERDGRDDFDPDDAFAFWDMTNRQDWHVCEQMQLGLRSRAYRPGRIPIARSSCTASTAHPRARAQRDRHSPGETLSRGTRRVLIRSAVASDRLDRTLVESCGAGCLLGSVARLLEDVAAVLGVVASEIQRGGFAAQVAVDARGIDIEPAGDVFGQPVVRVGHGAQVVANTPFRRSEEAIFGNVELEMAEVPRPIFR